jgi:hypothetical protein
MKGYYVEYRAPDGSYKHTELYTHFYEAYEKYCELIESVRGSDWEKEMYRTARIIQKDHL